jgi:tagatose-1,6-bisphosphate aldolase
MTSLDAIADPTGRFAILAVDQRASLRSMLDRAGQPSTDVDLAAVKVDIVRALARHASAVLLDAEYGTAAMRAAAGVSLLIASERSPDHAAGERSPGPAEVTYDPDRGPGYVTAHGGVALKFLLRWDPARPGGALDAVRAVVADCRAAGMPAVIEPLVPDPSAVARSAELLAAIEPDLLKLQWPGNAAGCRTLTGVCGRVPWALLSAGVAYRSFVDQVLAAVDAGACGYIGGRAFWGEAVALPGQARRGYLERTGAQRMSELNASLAGRGRSWREVA